MIAMKETLFLMQPLNAAIMAVAVIVTVLNQFSLGRGEWQKKKKKLKAADENASN